MLWFNLFKIIFSKIKCYLQLLVKTQFGSCLFSGGGFLVEVCTGGLLITGVLTGFGVSTFDPFLLGVGEFGGDTLVVGAGEMVAVGIALTVSLTTGDLLGFDQTELINKVVPPIPKIATIPAAKGNIQNNLNGDFDSGAFGTINNGAEVIIFLSAIVSSIDGFVGGFEMIPPDWVLTAFKGKGSGMCD